MFIFSWAIMVIPFSTKQMVGGTTPLLVSFHEDNLVSVPAPINPDAVNLDLSRNNITRLEETDFQGLNLVEWMNLDDNPISFINDNAFQPLISLQEISITKTNLAHLPQNF